MEKDTEDLYKQLNDIVNSIFTIKHKKIDFVPGVSNIPVNGRVFDEKEVLNAVNASLDFWLTDGPYAEEFNNKLSNFLGVKFSRLVNSGSSANLVALSSLTSSKLKNNLQPGDEVVTAAVGFPTTVNPIFQNNLTPVFVDCELGTYNPNIEDIISACSDKTKAIFLAHTLGNPFEVLELSKFCKENNIWLIEDNCDALGSKYNNKLTGTFGDISTLSFYPAHHITMGEGGAVLTSSTKLKLQIDSFRDWGRDCWCQSGHDNTCNKRYDWQLGDLPYGYDHKFTYSNIGYNLKATDLQASIGLAQLDKLDGFIQKRKSNWKKVNNYISSKKEYFIPHQATPGSEPSWFGYAITVRTDKFSRNDLIQHLNEHRIATRLMFGGNLIRQPAYSNRKFKVHNNLTNADTVMNHSFWIGVYPGITDEMYDYIFEVFENFLN
jgi:CDP-6-deoxy-D-xylo-4-hexulose-3-dehydrase